VQGYQEQRLQAAHRRAPWSRLLSTVPSATRARTTNLLNTLGCWAIWSCKMYSACLWTRAATSHTPPCASRGVDMFSRRGHAQRPRGRHTHTLGRSADMHRSEGGIGRVREAHGRPTRTAERATPPRGSDRVLTTPIPPRPPNARNPGSAAQTEEQSWASNRVHARRQGRRRARQIFRARARGSKVTDSRGGGR
jgi:hypothetical protein